MRKSIDDNLDQPFGSFQDFGAGKLAFLRELPAGVLATFLPEAQSLEPSLMLWALLDADGVPIIVSDTRQIAEMNARDRDIVIASVH